MAACTSASVSVRSAARNEPQRQLQRPSAYASSLVAIEFLHAFEGRRRRLADRATNGGSRQADRTRIDMSRDARRKARSGLRADAVVARSVTEEVEVDLGDEHRSRAGSPAASAGRRAI